MSKSSQHLYRCLDTMKADPNISEETKILMFVEYAKLVTEESKSNEWFSMREKKPTEHKTYEVYRQGSNKQHYSVWNGLVWAYNNKEITHWREIKSPRIKF